MHAGQRVTQGDVIGFVGTTGLATGPHLHYELRINGVHQNPLKVITSPAPGITAQNRQDFLQATQPLLNRLTLMHGMDVASIQ
jgi:murein DD-endopeptidase MepM/ murein hydrolase activator NlpD